MIDAAKTQIVLSHAGNECLGALGIGADYRDRHRRLIEAAHAKTVESIHDNLVETHFLTRTTVDGVEVVLLCASVPGSRHAGRDSRLVIRGAYSPEQAAALAVGDGGLTGFAKAATQIVNRKAIANEHAG